MIVIVAGVMGAGKTTVGRALAERLGWKFIDADEFHSADNWMKLARGEPLSEADRQPWLKLLREELARLIETKTSAVVACSALRRSYRVALIPANAGTDQIRMVYLRADRASIAQRLQARSGHRASPLLLDSQFATLEEPAEALWLDAAKPAATLVESIVSALNLHP